jgi:hypothetical protein
MRSVAVRNEHRRLFVSLIPFFNMEFGFREVDSVFVMEFDPAGTKPKRCSPALFIESLETEDAILNKVR